MYCTDTEARVEKFTNTYKGRRDMSTVMVADTSSIYFCLVISVWAIEAAGGANGPKPKLSLKFI